MNSCAKDSIGSNCLGLRLWEITTFIRKDTTIFCTS